MFNYTKTHVISAANTQAAKEIAFIVANAEYITKAKKTPYSAAVTTKAVVDLSTLAVSSYFRFEIFLRLNDSAQSDYSNALVFKEKPVYFEFKTGASAVDEPAVKIISEQFNADQTRYGYPVLKATYAGTTLTISGTNEYQTIVDAYVALWTSATTLDSYKGDFVKIVTPATTVTAGKIAFGSYEWILRNLRLPTMENRRFTSPNELEMPVPGVTYNQYTFYMRKDRGILGGASVGQNVTSETCHVFYVNSTLTANYCTALDTLVGATPLSVLLSVDSLVQGAGSFTASVLYLNRAVVPKTLTFGTAAAPGTPIADVVIGNLGILTTIELPDELAEVPYTVTATYVSNGTTYTQTATFTVS